jgi:hypothetical protein
MAINAPSTDLPTPTTTGSMLATAMRVAGTVPENITTATTPRAKPDTGIDALRIPILAPLTTQASTIACELQVILSAWR